MKVFLKVAVPAHITVPHRVFAEMKWSLLGLPLGKFLGTGLHRMDALGLPR